MKEKIKEYLKISYYTLLIYLILHLMYMFIIFDVVIPFSWVLDLPTMTENERRTIVFCYISVEFIKILVVNSVLYEKKNNNK
jgi:hypothetical protein